MRALAFALALLFAFPSAILGHWPVRDGRVSQWFGRHHRGVDIAAPRGTAIRPIDNGTVVYAGWRNNCGGWQVWIRHNRIYSAYYHMSRRPIVERGDTVTTRTRIGIVGATGCSTGPHVHIEVWKGYPWRAGSTRTNPVPYFASHPTATPKPVEPTPTPANWTQLLPRGRLVPL